MIDYLANRWFEKFFERKLHDLKENTWWKCRLVLEWPCQNQIKVINVFLNGNLYFLLLILVVYLESFPKHYNKVSLNTFRVMELESYSTAGVIHVCMCVWAHVTEFLRVCLRNLSTLLDTYAHEIESNPSQLNSIQLSSFFCIAFSFNFFILVDFFKAFFKIAAYSSNSWPGQFRSCLIT